MGKVEFSYFYLHESEQFNFYRIPKTLFTNTHFKKLSCEAKVLYGLMLDRVGLSKNNNWVDDKGRVFIYYTLEDVINNLGCCQTKAVKIFAELDSDKGIGLIERVRQGLGKPAIIYVKSFVLKEISKNEINSTTQKNPEAQTYKNQKSGLSDFKTQDLQKTEAQTFNNQRSKHSISKTPDLHISASNYNNLIDTDIIENQSINQSRAGYNHLKFCVKRNISYELLQEHYMGSEIDEIVDLITEVLSSEPCYYKISDSHIPSDIVRENFLKLSFEHIEYVLDCLHKNTSKVFNIKNYLIATLFNATLTIHNYYSAEVRHDLYGVKD